MNEKDEQKLKEKQLEIEEVMELGKLAIAELQYIIDNNYDFSDSERNEAF